MPGARGARRAGRERYLPDYRTRLARQRRSARQTIGCVSELREHAAGRDDVASTPPRHRAGARERRSLTATLTPDLVVPPVTMHNVLGIVEGRDPQRRGEMVVVGAHLDHDGTDAEGRIYNGADDNASGTAAVLAAAAAFARAAASGERPARAVAVRAVERRGERVARRGSVRRAPQPARRVVANLNLDMVGRHEEVPDPNDWRFHGLPKVDAAATGNTLHVLGYSYTPDLAAMLRGRQRRRRA